MNRRKAIRSRYKALRMPFVADPCLDTGRRMMFQERAATALQEACTIEHWDVLESLGMVRLRWAPDDAYYDDSYLDTWDISDEQRERIRQKLWESINRDGVWGLVGEYKLHPNDDTWEHGGSCWGFVGTDRNGSEFSIMQETIDALVEGLKSRKPRCSKYGQRG
jgi:hypothetical protein